jgi:hypothetical protein
MLGDIFEQQEVRHLGSGGFDKIVSRWRPLKEARYL